MTTVNKIVSAFLAALFLTGILGTTTASADENVLKTVSIETISSEEFFDLYER